MRKERKDSTLLSIRAQVSTYREGREGGRGRREGMREMG
jgi:hypothetical protein